MRLKGLAIGLIGLVGALLPLSAGAVQWVGIGEAEDNTSKVYVDADSIQRRGNTVQFWAYYVYRQPDADGVNAFKMLNEANCTTSDYRILRLITYVNWQENSDTKPNETYVAPPGTLGAISIQRVCKRR